MIFWFWYSVEAIEKATKGSKVYNHLSFAIIIWLPLKSFKLLYLNKIILNWQKEWRIISNTIEVAQILF